MQVVECPEGGIGHTSVSKCRGHRAQSSAETRADAWRVQRVTVGLRLHDPAADITGSGLELADACRFQECSGQLSAAEHHEQMWVLDTLVQIPTQVRQALGI